MKKIQWFAIVIMVALTTHGFTQNSLTMENNTVAVVQQCYTEFGKGNVKGVLDLLTDDILWIDPGFPDIPYAGKREGKTEVTDFFMKMGGTVEFTRFEPQLFVSEGNFVTVKGFFTGKNRSTQKAFESEWMMIWEVEGGKVKYYQAYIDTRNVAAAMK